MVHLFGNQWKKEIRFNQQYKDRRSKKRQLLEKVLNEEMTTKHSDSREENLQKIVKTPYLLKFYYFKKTF